MMNSVQNISFKLFFNDISFYKYKHNLHTDIFYQNIKKSSFIDQIKHPTVHWTLETTINNECYLFDLITNISSSNKYGAFSYKGINYIHNPCLIFKNNDFLINFIKNSNNNDFIKSKLYIDIYKKELLNKLYENSYNRGVLSYQLYSDINSIYLFKVASYKNLY